MSQSQKQKESSKTVSQQLLSWMSKVRLAIVVFFFVLLIIGWFSSKTVLKNNARFFEFRRSIEEASSIDKVVQYGKQKGCIAAIEGDVIQRIGAKKGGKQFLPEKLPWNNSYYPALKSKENQIALLVAKLEQENKKETKDQKKIDDLNKTISEDRKIFADQFSEAKKNTITSLENTLKEEKLTAFDLVDDKLPFFKYPIENTVIRPLRKLSYNVFKFSDKLPEVVFKSIVISVLVFALTFTFDNRSNFMEEFAAIDREYRRPDITLEERRRLHARLKKITKEQTSLYSKKVFFSFFYFWITINISRSILLFDRHAFSQGGKEIKGVGIMLLILGILSLFTLIKSVAQRIENFHFAERMRPKKPAPATPEVFALNPESERYEQQNSDNQENIEFTKEQKEKAGEEKSEEFFSTTFILQSLVAVVLGSLLFYVFVCRWFILGTVIFILVEIGTDSLLRAGISICSILFSRKTKKEPKLLDKDQPE